MADDPIIEIEYAPGRKQIMRQSQWERIQQREEERIRCAASKKLSLPQIQRVRTKLMLATREPTEIKSRAHEKELMDRHNLVHAEPPEPGQKNSYLMPEGEKYKQRKELRNQIGEALRRVKETSTKRDIFRETSTAHLVTDERAHQSGSLILHGAESKRVREKGITLSDQAKVKSGRK